MFKDKVYIAGYRGFVGSSLLKELKKRKYENILTSDELNLQNKNEVDSFFKKNLPDYVFVCAAKVGGIQANIQEPYTFLLNNLEIQNNVIDCCVKYKVKKTLFLGSSCIYPKDYIQPLKEEYLLQAPFELTNEGYALAKVCGLKLCEYANKQYQTKFISLIPPNLYGPGDSFDLYKSHVLGSLIKKIYNSKINKSKFVEIWGTGKAKREFLYIEDLVDGMIWAIETLDSTPSFLNIGTGKDISVFDLAFMISDIIGYKCAFYFNKEKPDGMLQKCLDIEKITNLGWKAKTSLKEGIQKTVEYYVTNDKIS